MSFKTMMVRLLSGVTLMLCLPLAAAAAEREYAYSSVPDWVISMPPDQTASLPAAQLKNGVYYLLSDEQVRLEGKERTTFRHVASRVVNDKGLSEAAEISIGFDPSYQTLNLHTLNVIRGGKVQNRLQTATIRVIQQESQLEYRIYDGRKTASVLLGDVRVGDIVEYAYSLRGANPVFNGRAFGTFSLGWNVPVREAHARLLVPDQRQITFRTYQSRQTLTPSQHDGYRDYRLQLTDVAPIHSDPDSPEWHDPYPWLQWTEFRDWNELVQWALPLYGQAEDLSPAVKAEADRISSMTRYKARSITEALRFVQREIRYLGVEIGASSHAPNAPDLVLQRRFGDCKDKARLLVTLLQALGIEAHPALVNTQSTRAIADWLPAPGNFDHVLVHVRHEGRDYWLDPTRPQQAGRLDNIYQPDYGMALVLAPDSRGLNSMSADSLPRRNVKKLDISVDASRGFDEAADFTVRTVAEGAAAEETRSVLASRSHDELQKQYLNFYAAYYKGLEIAAPLEVSDDSDSNRIVVTEHYLLKDVWEDQPERSRRETPIHVPDIEELLRAPANGVRTAPLRRRYPLDVTVTTRWLLPDTWTLKPEKQGVDAKSFSLEHSLTLEADDRLLVEVDRYRSKADNIPAAEVRPFNEALDKARGLLGSTLSKSTAPAAATPEDGEDAPRAPLADRFNWPVALFCLISLALLTQLAIRLYRYDPPPSRVLRDPSLNGIGGWLLLPALSLCVTPFYRISDLLDTLRPFSLDQWVLLTQPGQSAYDPRWAPSMLFELAGDLGLLVFSILLAVLFFQKRSSLPRLYIALTLFDMAILMIDYFLVEAVAPGDGGPIMTVFWRQGLALAIWGTYFMNSRRAAATFVQRCVIWNGKQAPPPDASREESVQTG